MYLKFIKLDRFSVHHEADANWIKRIFRENYFPFFKKEKQDEIHLVIQELFTNLIKHAQSPRFLEVYLWQGAGHPLLDIFSIDSGPGIDYSIDPFSDGKSSSHTLGLGLGVIQRKSDLFAVKKLFIPDGHQLTESLHTIGWTRISDGLKKHTYFNQQVCLQNQPLSEKGISGDHVYYREEKDTILLALIDGTGHGAIAHQAAEKACKVLNDYIPSTDPLLVARQMHHQLKGTRGAAISVFELFPERNRYNFWGVGNVEAYILVKGEAKQMLTVPGTFGIALPHLKVQQGFLLKNSTVLLHSDGVTNAWNEPGYRSQTALMQHIPGILAAYLQTHFRRGNDDSSVAVFHFKHPGEKH